MKKHILLIDDDKDELVLFYEALKEVPGSFKCTYASSGFHALEMLNYLQPDFIFIDFNMPVMSGVDLLEKIRQDRRLYDIPVFLYSTLISREVNNAAIKSGATGCIRKPGSIGMMAMVLKSILTGLGRQYTAIRQ